MDDLTQSIKDLNTSGRQHAVTASTMIPNIMCTSTSLIRWRCRPTIIWRGSTFLCSGHWVCRGLVDGHRGCRGLVGGHRVCGLVDGVEATGILQAPGRPSAWRFLRKFYGLWLAHFTYYDKRSGVGQDLASLDSIDAICLHKFEWGSASSSTLYQDENCCNFI